MMRTIIFSMKANRRILGILLVLLLGGCDGGSSGQESGTTKPPDITQAQPATITESLDRLGVDIVETPRISNEGVLLPEDYSPLGQRIKLSIGPNDEMHIGAPMELVMGGYALDGGSSFYSVIDNVTLDICPEANPYCTTIVVPQEVMSRGTGEAPWARETVRTDHQTPQTLRDVAGGDIDGDGQDELITVYAEQNQLVLRIHNLQAEGATEFQTLINRPSNIATLSDLHVIAGDVDDDGFAELIIAITDAPVAGTPTNTTVLILDDFTGGLAEIARMDYLSSVDNVSQYPVIAVANIDYDNAPEVIIILNESDFQGNSRHAATRFEILDDRLGGFSLLMAGTPTVETSATTYVPQVADVAVGDIDGDNLNEVVFGGVTRISEDRSCGVDAAGDHLGLNYLLAVYEFDGLSIAKRQMAHSLDQESLYPAGCTDSGAGSNYIRFLDVNLLDFDGDRDREIQANQFIFDTIPAPGLTWGFEATYTLPDAILFGTQFSDAAFHPGTEFIKVLDVNGDGREDLMTYAVGDDSIRIRAWRQRTDPPEPPDFYSIARIMIDTSDPDFGTFLDSVAINPLLLTLDADSYNEGDVQTLKFVGHEFTFTEPIVLAALAAPPCRFSIEQNTDACVTSWGQSSTTGVEGERDITWSASASAGVSVENDAGAGVVVDTDTRVFAFEAKLTLSEALSFIDIQSYEVTTAVSFESGPMEDSVVFSSIPYDVYVYEVISSTIVNTDDIGATQEIHRLMLPREPVVRLAERNYYNQNTTDSAVKIDKDVFTHTIGDLQSYPTIFDRDDILEVRRTQLEEERVTCPGCWKLDPNEPVASVHSFRQFDPIEALPGLVSDTVGIGQGGGQTEVSIDFGRSNTQATALEIGAEVEVEVIIGPVLLGVAFGRATTWSTSKTTGENTTYTGSAGSIGGDYFASERYRYGMFTYLQNDPDGSGQEFEVINYWVD